MVTSSMSRRYRPSPFQGNPDRAVYAPPGAEGLREFSRRHAPRERYSARHDRRANGQDRRAPFPGGAVPQEAGVVAATPEGVVLGTSPQEDEGVELSPENVINCRVLVFSMTPSWVGEIIHKSRMGNNP